MSKNGIERKGVPQHRLINARKIAVNSPIHDYRKAEKPQLPKQHTMWTWIKKNALKRLLPFIKENVNIDLKQFDDPAGVGISIDFYVLGELVYARTFIIKV